MFRRHHFLVLDTTLPLPFGSIPCSMTTLPRRLFLAWVERSAVVFPGLGAEQTLPVCPLQTLWPQAGGHRGCCLFKAALRWTTDQFDGRRTRSSGKRRGGGDMKGSEGDNLQLVEVRIKGQTTCYLPLLEPSSAWGLPPVLGLIGSRRHKRR